MNINEIKLVSVSNKHQIHEISKLAEEIWFDCYISIYSPQQIAYMLEKSVSDKNITFQVKYDHYYYYIIQYDNINVGYVSFKFMQNSMFLNNIYIKKLYRGKGIALYTINFLTDVCNAKEQKSIWLTVNINSRDTIAKYLSMGFKTMRSQKVNIGNGYIIDEFIMQKEL